MKIKNVFDECMKTSKQIVTPYLKESYDEDVITKQVWEVAIILFKYRLAIEDEM